VTATSDPAGVRLPRPAQMPPGWSRTSPTTATYTVAFDQVACTPVAPITPAVPQATCVNGALVAPLFALPTTNGVIYSVDPPGPYGGRRATHVVVTATLLDGFAWGESPPAGFAGPGRTPSAAQPVPLPEGWRLVSDTEARYSFTVPPSLKCRPARTPTTPQTPTTPAEGPTTPAEGPTVTTVPGELARTGAKADRIRLELILAALALAMGSMSVVIGRRRAPAENRERHGVSPPHQ
jgi:hypothetical protein